MKKVLICIITIFLVTVFSGCGNGGNEFVGKWIKDNDSKIAIEYKKNDSNYIMIYTVGTPEKAKSKEYAATYKDGIMSINASIGKSDATINKEEDSLIFDGQKYLRATEENIKKIKEKEENRNDVKKKFFSGKFKTESNVGSDKAADFK